MSVQQDVIPFTGFEGPEKKLLLDFVDNGSQGFRTLSKEQWQELVLNHAKCTIISVTVNEHFDAYLLSESSLFVYPSRLVLKTCGTTTLLKAVEPIMDLAKKMNLFVRRVFYSRKNYVFPENQPSPHKSFDEEVKLLDNYFVNGAAFIIGALNGDHYHLYFADYSKKLKLPSALPHQAFPILEMMMHDLSAKKMKNFFRTETFKSAQDTTDKTGISAILPGSTIDSFQFDPCGYSMNGLLNETYSTIHITPEHHCSYVSYEANCPPAQFDKPPAEYFDWLISNVIMVFKPKKFTITLFAHDTANNTDMCEVRKTSSCFDTLIPKLKAKYSLKAKTLYELPGQHNISLLHFIKRKKGMLKTPATPCDEQGTTNQDMLAKFVAANK